ncbi:MAG: tRNA (N(6)-L-threonylcarbamoyladenosine(37)-C(2))-methylthiotransferase MtaB [Myxococcales bacterium]|nr:tRNA (N(6)-L-threonylcarbamoyladenosine(37)-C(2))-methylthiotransferase MtaB [Myxococcales bacterium]MCB9713303.1 tRNA (N(6)-L-threonylcarbamoyladenosine(37)-C(2))-methylthiotransferase MtaB [Myxococcales bacterium]
MRVAIDTHGCRLNRFESDAMAEALEREGHTLVEDPGQADVYLLNTCTVTHAADADARRAVRRARRSNPELSIVLTGCHVDAEPERAASLPGVRAVLGNADKGGITELLRRLGPGEGPPLVSVTALTRRMPFTPLAPAVVPRRSRALLKVQDGCNYRCAFCIVPQVRGPSRSLAIDEVVAQAGRIVAAGIPELVLTGVHLGTYGRDLRPRRRLPELVRALLPQLGPSRLRLSSIDPQEIDDELLTLMAEHPGSICRHLHLPVQAGDDGVLRRMRRGHTAATFGETVERAAARVPGIAIGTDVIVGFPGEDEAAFRRSEALLRRLPLAYLHVFPFSARQGTAAATMPDAVPERERARRGAVLRELSEAMVAARREAAAGRIADVVVHRRPDREGGYGALTDDFLRVRLPAEQVVPGGRMRVRLGLDGREARAVGADADGR